MSERSPHSLVATLTGRQKPGLLARIFGALAQGGLTFREVEQSAIGDSFVLGIELQVAAGDPALAPLQHLANEANLTLRIRQLDPAATEVMDSRWVLTALGRPLLPAHVEELLETLGRHGGIVERMRPLTSSTGDVLEMGVALPTSRGPEELQRELLALAMDRSFDIALQGESLYRRARRLVVFDMDSTLIRIEVIDELARAHGVVDRVAAITEKAMQGEMDFDESLRQRVGLLAGLDVRVLHDIAAHLPLMEGAETLVKVLKRLGYRVAVISGGFSIAAEALKERLGLDAAHSNVLEVADGRLTGRVVGGIVNAARKAELLEEIARAEGLLPEQVIAVGDGANDLLMLQKAGLGVAFRGKPKLRQAADTSLSVCGLDGILYLLGMTEEEIAHALGNA